MRSALETVVPLERNRLGLLQVSGRLNGAPATLLVDTGASTTVLDRSAAERLGLSGTGADAKAVGCVPEGAAELAEINTLQLGEVRLATLRVAVVELSHVNGQFQANGCATVDGLVGADVLAQAGAVISYVEPELRMRAAD